MSARDIAARRQRDAFAFRLLAYLSVFTAGAPTMPTLHDASISIAASPAITTISADFARENYALAVHTVYRPPRHFQAAHR